jgi:hypothetical protein
MQMVGPTVPGTIKTFRESRRWTVWSTRKKKEMNGVGHEKKRR